MKHTISILFAALFLTSILAAQSSVNIYTKNFNDSETSKVIAKLEALPAVEKAEKEHGYANYLIYVKEGEEQSYKEIQTMWNDPVPKLIRVRGRIKVVMNDAYAGKFDDAILDKMKRSKNTVKSAENIDKGVFIIEFKEPGISANSLKTNFFARRVKPIPNPLTFESLFTDIFFLPAE